MNLKEKIQEHRKTHPETRTVLGTLLGELDRIDKHPSDEQIISVLKKMIESNVICGNTEENNILELFTPKQLTTDEIEYIISKIEFNNIGECMAFFKTAYKGMYNGSEVSKIFQNKRN